MISLTKKFIFVHIYKTAGSSVRDALKEYFPRVARRKRFINNLLQTVAGKKLFFEQLAQHATAMDYKEYLEEKYDSYFKFAFVRNPFDWEVSQYQFAVQTPVHPQYELFRSMPFGEYIRWRCREAPVYQLDFVSGSDGSMIVDRIGKFETLERDFASICATLGIRAQLRHINQSRRGKAALYYDEDTRKLVADTFARDFEAFGYSKEIEGR